MHTHYPMHSNIHTSPSSFKRHPTAEALLMPNAGDSASLDWRSRRPHCHSLYLAPPAESKASLEPAAVALL